MDFDGTLSKLAAHPEHAIFSKNMKQAVLNLIRSKRFQVSIVSGRSLKSVKQKVGIKNIFYAGNHGFEVSGPNFSWKLACVEAVEKEMPQIAQALKKVGKIPGVYLEEKKISLSVHFRHTPKKLLSSLKKEIKKAAKPFMDRGLVKIHRGKKIFEVRPNLSWDKGRVVELLIKKLQLERSLNIFIGDDITDEDAFKVLRNKNFGIKVGSLSGSWARYGLKNTEEVEKFLVQAFSLCHV